MHKKLTHNQKREIAKKRKARIALANERQNSKPKSPTVFSAIKKILALGVFVLILACFYFLIF